MPRFYSFAGSDSIVTASMAGAPNRGEYLQFTQKLPPVHCRENGIASECAVTKPGYVQTGIEKEASMLDLLLAILLHYPPDPC